MVPSASPAPSAHHPHASVQIRRAVSGPPGPRRVRHDRTRPRRRGPGDVGRARRDRFDVAIVSEGQDVVDLSLPATGSLDLSRGATRTLRYVQEGWDTGRSRRASRVRSPRRRRRLRWPFRSFHLSGRRAPPVSERRWGPPSEGPGLARVRHPRDGDALLLTSERQDSPCDAASLARAEETYRIAPGTLQSLRTIQTLRCTADGAPSSDSSVRPEGLRQSARLGESTEAGGTGRDVPSPRRPRSRRA